MKNPLFSLSIIVFSIFSPTIIFVTDADCFPLPLNGMTNNAPLELHIFSRFEVSPHEAHFFFGISANFDGIKARNGVGK